MGTIFAPTYATLVMRCLENKLFLIIETKFDTETKNILYRTGIDDLDDFFCNSS